VPVAVERGSVGGIGMTNGVCADSNGRAEVGTAVVRAGVGSFLPGACGDPGFEGRVSASTVDAEAIALPD
jgi:hypothetical protein